MANLSPEERELVLWAADQLERLAGSGVPSIQQLRDLAEHVALPTTVPEATSDDLEEFGSQHSLRDVRQFRALKAFVVSGRIIDACKAANISYSSWYRWMAEDKEFARAFEQTKRILADDLEGVAIQRARESSDTLLIALLKSMNPERYRERHVIEVVSPVVISKLGQQADAILEVCNEIAEGDKDTAARYASAIANRLRDIWAH